MLLLIAVFYLLPLSLCEERTVKAGLLSKKVQTDGCHPSVCYKTLPSDAAWKFLNHTGVVFVANQEHQARDIERCHIYCLDKFFAEESLDRSKGVDLYSLNSTNAERCAKACSGQALGLSPEVLCKDYFICGDANYTLKSFVRSNLSELKVPSLTTPSYNHTQLRKYGLMQFKLDPKFPSEYKGVVWQVRKKSEDQYVSQQLLYAFLHDTLGNGKWVGSFNTPTFQCTERGVGYQLVTSTLVTKFSEPPAVSNQCFEGEIYPDPPNIQSGNEIANISNGTKENPHVEVKLFLLDAEGDNHKADKGLRIEATDKLKGDSVPPYKEPYCNPLNDTAVLTYERPESQRFVSFKGSGVPWEVFWYCYRQIEFQYYLLPKPPAESGKLPRVTTVIIDSPRARNEGFYPFKLTRHNTNDSQHMGYIVTANHTDDCAVDANITFSVKVANISLLFLSSIRINMTNITKLPEVIISDKPLKEKKGTTIDLTPEEDGLLVTITQVARGVNITKDQIAKSQLLFGSTYFDYTYHLYFPVPSSGKPKPVENITFLEYQVLISSDRVLAKFSWLSVATPCYPHPTYHILLRSPLSKNHHIEDYFATEINGTVYYQLNTTWYSDEYYNLTVVVGYGKDSRTEGITKQFTMTGPPTATTARVHVPLIIAGSLVGGIALIVLPIILCCFFVSCWCYRRNKQEAIKDVIWVGGEHDESEFEAFEPLRDMRLEPIQMDEWELPPHEIIMERKISDGNFGEVYKASIVSVTMHVKPGTPVAVKMLKFNTSESLKGDFLREIAIMKKISRNRSPFVVNLIGCCTLQEPFCLILEFVAHGDLLTYLRTMRRKVQKENDYCNVPSKQEMVMEKEGTERGTADQTVAPEEELEEPYWELGDLKPSHLLSFAYQIASGMEYLSNMSVVHRDLACRNILVDKDKMLKIADFGLSREGEMYISKTTGQVPLRWMSVETIRDRVFTTKSDVWSYGITLWEIGTLGGYPYPTHNNRELLEALQKGYRLSKPANCTNDIYLIMQQCWNEDPECRPSFSDLRCKMDHMLSSTHKENYIHLLVDEMQPYYNLVPAMERASHESLPSIESNSVGGECIQLETIDHTEDRTTSEAREEKDLLKASQYQVMISPQKKESTSEGLIESYL